MVENEDLEAAGFYLQQPLEKFLKAFLLKNGWQLKKIHELDTLLDNILIILPELKEYPETCERVSGYYMLDRYPTFFSSDISLQDLKEDISKSEKLIHLLFPEEKINIAI
ncbi:MAG: HEPN domain-containing protein [Candidatus Atribacteria bacterium]|nr:HEPN domain-containing protein [Candidatus Atribacteria bacterium]